MKTKELPPIRVEAPLYAAIKKTANKRYGGNLSETVRTVLRAVFLPAPIPDTTLESIQDEILTEE